jgi:TPR repeat protein
MIPQRVFSLAPLFAALSTVGMAKVRGTVVALAALVSCTPSRERTAPGGPAPSESAVTLGIALGTCSDIPTCERECDAGSADRCRRLAASYSFGQGGLPKDEAHAVLLYEQACRMKDPSSCMFAGQMSEFGRGAPKDPAKAIGFYREACDLHWVAGCYNLGIMYERGTGVPADVRKAIELYRGACDAGALTACAKAAELTAHSPEGGAP